MRKLYVFLKKHKSLFIKLSAIIIVGLMTVLSMKAQNPVASFTSNATSGCVPLTVDFINTSTNINPQNATWFWDFGNGNTSTAMSPANVYVSTGTFTVSLTATNTITGAQNTVTMAGLVHVSPNPVADFHATTTTACLSGNNFSFINTSTNATTYIWDFGDGITVTTANPTHHYSGSGTYTVTLVASNFACTDTRIQAAYINVVGGSTPAFTTNTQGSCSLSTLFNFTNTTPNSINSIWYFGDGATSNTFNSQHTYSTYGSFNITLISTSTTGCIDTLIIPNYISLTHPPAPVVTSSMVNGCSPLTVSFTGQSPTATAWMWDFGNGTTDTVQNPTCIYTAANGGVFTITLTITDMNGCTATTTMTNYITVSGLPTSTFTPSTMVGCGPLTLSFANTAIGYVSCLWNFGDGSTDTSANPTHTYMQNGFYHPVLYVTNAAGCTQSSAVPTLSVHNPTAIFNTTTSVGCAPLTVHFVNTSINSNSWFWDFGDGTTSSNIAPSHTYWTAGNYTVKLYAYNTGCVDSLIRSNYIQILNPTISYTPPPTVTACAPLTVNFTDATTGSISWLWNFGDGDTSTNQNCTHTYSAPGFYTVSCTTQMNGGCINTINPFNTFRILGAEARFTVAQDSCPPFIATFTDSSITDTSAHIVSWLWNFGDGTTSVLQNPTHNYQNAGSYTVSLTITTSDGCVNSSVMNNIVNFLPLDANILINVNGNSYPMIVDFFANTTGATSWFWTFGDSTSSTDENPIHTYMIPGYYPVTLTITNILNCSTTFTELPDTSTSIGGNMIPDSTAGVVTSNYLPSLQTGCAPLTVNFVNTGNGGASWIWDFGDGSPIDTNQNPSHTFFSPGDYTITLITTNGSGFSDTLVQPNAIHAIGAVSFFSTTIMYSCQNITVACHDSSVGANSWFWDFGDGFTSTLQNPVHTYFANNNNYTITLVTSDTTNITGCISTFANSFNAGIVNPVIAADTNICSVDSAHFSSLFQSGSTVVWDFGDAQTSSLANPSHLYTSPGSYIVTFSVTDTSGCSRSFILGTPLTVSAPFANFTTFGNLTGCSSFPVTFINTSAQYDSCVWDFGDGSTETIDNPVHTYSTTGIFSVSLTVYLNGCPDTHIIPNLVHMIIPVAAFSYTQNSTCLPVTISCIDSSLNAASWLWNFGDGSTDTIQNPSHIYTSAPGQQITLVVTNVDGCTDTISNPSISLLNTAFSASGAVGCAPLVVTFTDSSQNAASWLWDFGDGSTSTMQNPIHIYNFSGNFTVTLTTTGVWGCTQTISFPSLVDATAPVANFTTPIQSNCAPILISFVDLSVNASSWLWDFGDGTGSTIQNPAHVYSTPGLFTVSLMVWNSNGCPDSLVITDYIHVLGPVASFNLSGLSGCSNILADFNDLSINAISWDWNFGDGYSSSQQSPQHNYTNPGNYPVTLIVQDSIGCSSYFSTPVNIQIPSWPVASFTSADTNSCELSNVTFLNNSVNGVSYEWNFGDNTTDTAANPSHIYSSPGTYFVSLIANGISGCSDTFNFPTPFIVHPLPVPSFHTSANTTCLGVPTLFTNTSLVNSPSIFNWSFGDGNTSTLFNPINIYTTGGTFNVVLMMTDSFGCRDSVVGMTPVTIVGPGTLSCTTPDTAGCVPYTAAFWGNFIGYASATWDFGDGNSGTGFNPSHIYVNPGVYQVTVMGVSLSGCIDTIVMSTHITVTPQPVADFTFNITNGCGPFTVSFTNQSSNTINPTYFWDFGNGQTSVLSNPIVTYTNPGLYSIMLVVSNSFGCVDTIVKSNILQLSNPGFPIQLPIQDVTVSNNTGTYIVWEASTDPGFHSYELYRKDPISGTFNLINTETNASNHSYYDVGLNTLQNVYCYKMRVVNACGVSVPLDSIEESCSINITAVASGANNIDITWTPYVGCQVSSYEVYRIDYANSLVTVIATVPAWQLNYTDVGFDCPTQLAYRVRGLDLCGTQMYSNSDTSMAVPGTILNSQTSDITFSSVIHNVDVYTEWKPPVIMPERVAAYILLRSNDNLTFHPVDTLANNVFNYIDKNVYVNTENYYYKIKVISTCGTVGALSNLGSSILLNLREEPGSEKIHFRWTDYQEWNTGVEKYVLERLNDQGIWETVKTIDPSITETTDQN